MVFFWIFVFQYKKRKKETSNQIRHYKSTIKQIVVKRKYIIGIILSNNRVTLNQSNYVFLV